MTPPRFTIYCHTNRVNGKRYVGQTVYSMEERWRAHVSAAKSSRCYSPVFANAIIKYGADAFDHQVLEVVSTQEAADEAESRWIEQLTCRVPDGYNLESGGGGRGVAHEDTRHLLSERHISRWQKMTPEEYDNTKRRISEKSRAWWQRMTAEERSTLRKMSWTPERKARARIPVPKIKRVDSLPPKTRSLRKYAPRKPNTKNPAYSKQMSEWQTARQKSIAPEHRRATVLKAWATRRAKYGKAGAAREKTRAEYSEGSKKGWAALSPETRAERGRKIREGRRVAKEARASRFVRINLLPTESRA